MKGEMMAHLTHEMALRIDYELLVVTGEMTIEQWRDSIREYLHFPNEVLIDGVFPDEQFEPGTNFEPDYNLIRPIGSQAAYHDPDDWSEPGDWNDPEFEGWEDEEEDEGPDLDE